MTAQQLGFGFEQILEEQQTAHLPATMAEAIPFYRGMIDRHHQAMLAGDEETAMAIRKDARRLARKLNGGDHGILAHDDSPGRVLERETTAPVGTIPLWGQAGDFTITVGTMPVRVTMDGMFGIASSISFWPGFETHAVEMDKPFLSETGYRSFTGCHATVVPGMTPDTFAERMIEAFVKSECRKGLRAIEPAYRQQ